MSQYHIPLLGMVQIKKIRPVFNRFIKKPYNNGICILQYTMGVCHCLVDACETCAGMSERENSQIISKSVEFLIRNS